MAETHSSTRFHRNPFSVVNPANPAEPKTFSVELMMTTSDLYPQPRRVSHLSLLTLQVARRDHDSGGGDVIIKALGDAA